MKAKFILTSVVSLTLMGVAPSVFAADRDNNRLQIRDENRLDYNQLPGEVKQAIGAQLNSGDKVTDVYKYNRGGRTIYVAYTNDERVIRADDRGNLLSVKSTEDEADSSNRTAVKYNSLPGEVKDTLGKEAKGHPMEIWKVNRGGKAEYVAYIDMVKERIGCGWTTMATSSIDRCCSRIAGIPATVTAGSTAAIPAMTSTPAGAKIAAVTVLKARS